MKIYIETDIEGVAGFCFFENRADMIYAGVKRGIARRSEIKPFHIPGPVRLNLLDSPGHIEHKEMLPEDVEAPTIDQAFMEFERRMSWNCFDTSKVDGFVFP